MSQKTYTFKTGDKTIMTQGYDIEQAMWLADLSVQQTANGFWKLDINDHSCYTWTQIKTVSG